MTTRTLIVAAVTATTIAVAGAATLGIVQGQGQEAQLQPSSWNAEKSRVGNTVNMRIYSGVENYYDGTQWKKVDLTLKEDASGFHMSKSMYTFDAPKTSAGKFKFNANSKFSIEKNKFISDAPIQSDKTFPTAESVPGELTAEGILYPGAFPSINGDLLVKLNPTGVSYLVRINSEPAGSSDISIPFKQKLSENLTVKNEKTSATVSGIGVNIGGGVKVERGDQKISVLPTYVWDSSSPEKRQQIQTIGYFNAAKTVPRSFLNGATYPVYTDATVQVDSGTEDQAMYSYNEPGGGWAATYAGTNETGESTTATSIYAQAKDNGGGNFQAYFSVLSFATGDQIAGGTVSAASIFVYFSAVQAETRTYKIVRSRQSLPLSTAAEWDENGDTGYGAGTVYASATRNATTAAGYQELALSDFTQVATTAGQKTQLSIVDDKLWSNTSPTGLTEGGAINSGDNGSNKPYISVTYTVPSTSKPIIIIRALEKLIPFAYAND